MAWIHHCMLQRSGTAVPSYTSSLLDSHRGQDGVVVPEDEEDIKGSAGTLFTGKTSLPCIFSVIEMSFVAAEDTVSPT